MFEAELKELGLTENETKLYLALLSGGAQSPTRLAEVTGLHRSYVYDTLERLLEKNIITAVMLDGKKGFQAQDPKILKESFELKLRQLDTILPQLARLFSEKREPTRIELHKGRRVYRTLIKDLTSELKKGDEVLLIGVDETILDTVEPIYLKQYFTILKEKSIRERIVIAKGAKRLREKNLTYKELDASYFGKTATVLYQDKVYFFIWGEPHYLVVIESKEIADAHRKQFEWLWRLAE